MPAIEEKANEKKAARAVRRTLSGIKFRAYSARVIMDVSDQADANDRIRTKSLAKAGNYVVR